ncbi:hypothetical protein KX928_02225 [Roseobacter sp. YSTF-M11]|uniref:Lysozyme inhibitor LprI N-terminal domain-containing protein n=1 Tax=Roseobacter insulae TaxID=2859783 RepID=A0A9X1FS19_9RHOB|nr:hypothetical protein [Roseobacter insulae]MBW4706593.1 hypothetical protein [Roseobacter insulae]
MRRLKTYTLAILLTVAACHATAQEQDYRVNADEIDPVSCLRAVSALSSAYRYSLQTECVSIALKKCSDGSEPALCAAEVVRMVEGFVVQSRPMLPAVIGASEFKERAYRRRLQNLDARLAKPQACADAGTAFDEQACKIRYLSLMTWDLLTAARMAYISLR